MYSFKKIIFSAFIVLTYAQLTMAFDIGCDDFAIAWYTNVKDGHIKDAKLWFNFIGEEDLSRFYVNVEKLVKNITFKEIDPKQIQEQKSSEIGQGKNFEHNVPKSRKRLNGGHRNILEVGESFEHTKNNVPELIKALNSEHWNIEDVKKALKGLKFEDEKSFERFKNGLRDFMQPNQPTITIGQERNRNFWCQCFCQS